jgi:hypothetical protein
MFFAPFAVIMLATRFVGMRWLQLLPPPVVVGLGCSPTAPGSSA